MHPNRKNLPRTAGHATPAKVSPADCPPTLPRAVADLIDPDYDSPLEWAGEWFRDDAGNWRYRGRWKTASYRFDPSTVPEPVRQDAARALDRLQASMRPASDAEIENGLKEIAIVCGSRASDGEEVWAARYAIYAKHLADIPRDILRRAMDEHIRTSVFFPKISELRALAQAETGRRRLQANRLRKLVGPKPNEDA